MGDAKQGLQVIIIYRMLERERRRANTFGVPFYYIILSFARFHTHLHTVFALNDLISLISNQLYNFQKLYHISKNFLARLLNTT